jgi:hypothetical protein
MTRAPRRSFTLHLIRNCPEAQEALRLWREGELTFEEAMMEVVKRLFLARETLQRKYDYIPPDLRAAHQPPD